MKQITILSLTALVAFASCKHKTEEPVSTNQKFVLSDSMRHIIQIDTVSNCNLADQLTLSGEVSFNENNVVKVFPRGSGQVIESKVSLGDKVAKGQVLAVVRSADIAGSYSDLNSANADLAIAKRQMDNAQSLYKSGISSQREYTEAQQNYEKALAAKSKIQSSITINGGSRTSANGEYFLTAPIDGYIVEKKVTAGSFIRSDASDNLFTISDLKSVWIYANVYEADIPKVHAGYPVNVTPMSYPDKTYTGKVAEISQVLDPQSKVMRVRIELDNKDMLLKPDMFAKVVVNNVEGTSGICVPASAILSQDGKDYVVVYNNDSDLQAAEVSVITSVNNKTYVSSGVTPGQKVITKNQLLIFSQLQGE